MSRRVIIIVIIAVIAMKGGSRYVAERNRVAEQDRKESLRRLIKRTNPLPPGANPPAPTEVVQAGNPFGGDEVRRSGEAAPPRDEAFIRSMLTEGRTTTYIQTMLQQRRLLMRWQEHHVDALRIWIQRNSEIENWQRDFAIVAERGFEEWREAGFPVRFDRVTDSASAQIRISWVSSVQSIRERTIGRTRMMHDEHGWLISADIVVATHDGRGEPLSAGTIGGVARHEIGHALGLGHSPNKTDVMYPESTTPVISAVDRATLHLLYRLPPGYVR